MAYDDDLERDLERDDDSRKVRIVRGRYGRPCARPIGTARKYHRGDKSRSRRRGR